MLPEATRTLIRLSAALGSGSEAAWCEAMEAARPLAPARVEEIVLQSYLFLGFPVVLSAMESWRDICPASAPDADEPVSPGEIAEWTARGERVCRMVYGRAYENLRANVVRLHPVLDRWMISEGYGKVLGRPGVDLPTRELCIVGLLARQGWLRQLRSHLHGALNAGAAPGEVEAALEIGLEGVGADRGGPARQLWARLREARANPMQPGRSPE